MAFGQAAMLLSLGKKGYRAVQPHSSSMVLSSQKISTFKLQMVTDKTVNINKNL